MAAVAGPHRNYKAAETQVGDTALPSRFRRSFSFVGFQTAKVDFQPFVFANDRFLREAAPTRRRLVSKNARQDPVDGALTRLVLKTAGDHLIIKPPDVSLGARRVEIVHCASTVMLPAASHIGLAPVVNQSVRSRPVNRGTEFSRRLVVHRLAGVVVDQTVRVLVNKSDDITRITMGV